MSERFETEILVIYGAIKIYVPLGNEKHVHKIQQRLPYCLNVVDFIRAMTLSSCKTVLRHTAQK